MNEQQPQSQGFDAPCIVEIMGHVKLAGRVSEQIIAGQAFVRVDVPATGKHPAFTRFFGPSSIYSITPVSEEIACYAASRMKLEPVHYYYLPPTALPAADDDANGDGGASDAGDDDYDFAHGAWK